LKTHNSFSPLQRSYAVKACESTWRWLGLQSASSGLSRELDRMITGPGDRWGPGVQGAASPHQGTPGTRCSERGNSLVEATTLPPPIPAVALVLHKHQ
jgi:hypothetical protein